MKKQKKSKENTFFHKNDIAQILISFLKKFNLSGLLNSLNINSLKQSNF